MNEKIRNITARLAPVLLGAIAVGGLSVLSCTRPDPSGGEPDIPPVTAPFSVSFDIQDGERDAQRLIRHPEVRFSLSSEDDVAAYTLVYSINGGQSKTVKNIWDGTTKNLSSDFLEFEEYGSYSLKGYVYNTGAAADRVPVDTVVMIAYSPAQKKSISFATLSRSGEFEEGEPLVLYENESGTFFFEYTPSTTILPLSTTSSDPSVVKIAEGSDRTTAGVYSVGFKALRTGSSTITFTAVNGREKIEYAASVDVQEDTDGKAVYVSMATSSDLVFDAMPLTVLIDGSAGDGTKRFNIDYFIDGAPAASDTNVPLSEGMSKTLDHSALSLGKHTVSIRVSAIDGAGSPIVREADFTVATPRLSVSGGAYDGTVVGPASTLSLDTGKAYTFSMYGVPSSFTDRFTIAYTQGKYSISGAGPWVLSPTSFGRAPLGLRYICAGREVDVFSINALTKDICTVSAEWVYETDPDSQDESKKVSRAALVMGISGKYASSVNLNVSGTVGYHGLCEYPVASNPMKEGYYNTLATASSDARSLSFSATVSGTPSTVADLTHAAREITSQAIQREFWTDQQDYKTPIVIYDMEFPSAWLDTALFYYFFVLDKVSLEGDSSYEGLSFSVSLKGLSPSQVTTRPPFI